jgi:hypothetical protein
MRSNHSNICDLIVDQGATVHRVFAIKNAARKALTLDGYVARMQVRNWDVETRDPELIIVAEYTTENGYISIDAAKGSIILLIPPAIMAAYEPKSYVYDLEVESSTGETTRIVQGKFIVRAEVTR